VIDSPQNQNTNPHLLMTISKNCNKWKTYNF